MAGSSAIKIVLMGQGGVGKTAMVLRYTNDEFIDGYLPTIGDMHTKDVEIQGAPRHLEIDDTAGQEAYADLRDEKLGSGDGYLLVYAINDDTTFSTLDRLRDAILEKHRGRAPPIFLVGTKSDLEEDRAVMKNEAKRKAKKWGSKAYECSAKENDNVEHVFNKMVTEILKSSTDPTKGGGGGSVFAGGAAPAPEVVAATRRPRCMIL